MKRYKLKYVSGCEVVGESYYKDEIANLGTIAQDYYWPSERLYEKFVEGDRVYKYNFPELDAQLIPEPENPHDPNAIRVTVDGKTVGYIARDSTARISEMLSRGLTVKANVTGGPHKDINETEDGMLASEKEDYDFRVRLSFYEKAVVIEKDAAPGPEAPQKVFSDKNHTTALLLAIFLGGLGIHRFYAGKTGTGILWLLTGGVFGVGWFVDVVWLLGNCFDDWSGAPIVSDRGKARMIAQGYGAQRNAVPEVFCWLYIGLAVLLGVAMLRALIVSPESYPTVGSWFFPFALGVGYPCALAWVISKKGLE